MKKLIVAVFAITLLSTGTALAAAKAPKPPKQEWSFDGIFGTYDRAAAQRGFHVYKTVCAACHSLNYVYYRHLSGIGLKEDQIKAIAATVEVQDGPNDDGEMFTRKGLPRDRFVAPFPNDKAARAANTGAPQYWAEPAAIRGLPNVPLCPSRGRVGKWAAAKSAVVNDTGTACCAGKSGGILMSTTTSLPQIAAPGKRK